MQYIYKTNEIQFKILTKTILMHVQCITFRNARKQVNLQFYDTWPMHKIIICLSFISYNRDIIYSVLCHR